ncbi:uncharacterized protein METZ01_LOCUS118711 [marine metagenome]|uniref:Uncharacterized protein n=1 Tax=marine metagenome TaxID=408172 RepID=A0A381XNP7_9ZZZZ
MIQLIQPFYCLLVGPLFQTHEIMVSNNKYEIDLNLEYANTL